MAEEGEHSPGRVEEVGVGEGDDDVVEPVWGGIWEEGRKGGCCWEFGRGRGVDGLVWLGWIKRGRMVWYCLSMPDVLLAMRGWVTGRTG